MTTKEKIDVYLEVQKGLEGITNIIDTIRHELYERDEDSLDWSIIDKIQMIDINVTMALIKIEKKVKRLVLQCVNIDDGIAGNEAE